MKSLRSFAALVPLGLAACGGPSASEFEAAAPRYLALAIDVDDAASQSGMGGSMMPLSDAVSPADLCHPHLFMRTEGLAGRINRHFWKLLRLAEEVTARNADIVTGATAVWETTRGMFHIRFTTERTGPTTFTWLLEVMKDGDPGWTAVMTGDIDRLGATGPHQGTGRMELDLTALHGVVPMEPATGKIAVDFATFDDHRKLAVTAADVAWDFGGEMGVPAALHLPRNSHYVYYRKNGVGGSLKAVDDMAFACPPPAAGAEPLAAHVLLVSRWYRADDGTVHGRSDAKMTGGQLAAPVANIQGVTCHQGARDGSDQAESFWLLKAESDLGATVHGWSPLGLGPEACDPVLGATVPTLDDAANDYLFPDASTMANDDPFPFPGGP